MNRKERKGLKRKRKLQERRAQKHHRKPRFVACHYRIDLVHPTVEVLLDAYRAAQEKWLTLPYRPLPDGSEPNRCWLNVEKAIELWSGEMQVAWCLRRSSPLPGDKNALADVEAIPHAVWKDSHGRLYEVSEDCKGLSVVTSDVVKPFMALNVGFCDSLFNARTYRPADPGSSDFQPSQWQSWGNFYCRISGGPPTR